MEISGVLYESGKTVEELRTLRADYVDRLLNLDDEIEEHSADGATSVKMTRLLERQDFLKGMIAECNYALDILDPENARSLPNVAEGRIAV